MNKILIMPMMFFSVMMVADDHNKSDKNTKERMQNHPNHLLSYKECKETKDGIEGLLSAADFVWKEIEMNPENEKKMGRGSSACRFSSKLFNSLRCLVQRHDK